MVDPSQVLPVAAAAGVILLRCGADVARVEDTIARIARAYDIEEVETYATPTGLFITMGTEAKRVTTVKRVAHRTMALDRVSAVNALSRELATARIEPAEALRRIQDIEGQPHPVALWTDVPLSGLAAASCTMLVGGTLQDFGPALLSNLVVQGVQRLTLRSGLPGALADYLAGLSAVLCAMALHALVQAAVAPVVAGGVMVLVPGTAFTAAVRDAMAGDLVSSGARGLEAFMKAAALASGVATALYFLGEGAFLL